MTRRMVAMVAIALTMMVAAPAGASNAPMAITAPAGAIRPAVRVDPPAPPPISMAEQVVNAVNAERVKLGLAPLQSHPSLMRAAQKHSEEQAFADGMSHLGFDGSNAGQRMTREGYAWRGWAENVAAGQRDAPTVVKAWMDSAGHRKNNLGPYVHVGVGLAYSNTGRPYWTMVFGVPR